MYVRVSVCQIGTCQIGPNVCKSVCQIGPNSSKSVCGSNQIVCMHACNINIASCYAMNLYVCNIAYVWCMYVWPTNGSNQIVCMDVCM